MRKQIQYADNEYYHVYNRGAGKANVFLDPIDSERFLACLRFFNRTEPIGSLHEFMRTNGSESVQPVSKLVTMVAYCLNPNHYHLLLKQEHERGISEFMQRVGTGYTGYFNNRHERSGVLFQGRFKAVHLATNEALLNVSAYVNLNNKIHNLEQFRGQTPKQVRSSWHEYIGQAKTAQLCDTSSILEQFQDASAYKKFAQGAADVLRANKLEKENAQELMFE